MGDVFIEQMIKRKNDGAAIAKQVGIVVLALLLLMVAFYFMMSPFMPIAFMVAAGTVYGAWWLITGQNLEFEYIYTNGEMDIDKVIAKRKRKRVTTVRIASFDEFEPFQMERYRQQQYDITINAAVSMNQEGSWYASYRNRDGKKCCLVFTPEEKLLKEIQAQYKRKAFMRSAT